MGLVNSDLEPCLFVWREGDRILLYVDDILMLSNDAQKMNEVQEKLNRVFEMNILGEPKEFLGINIRRDRSEKKLDLCQKKYIDNILKRCGFDQSYPKTTPMATNKVSNHE